MTVNYAPGQFWNQQEPHKHDRTPGNYEKSGLGGHHWLTGWWGHMKCRNPDGEARIWCYTLNKAKRWEFCAENGPECCNQRYDKHFNPTSHTRSTVGRGILGANTVHGICMIQGPDYLS